MGPLIRLCWTSGDVSSVFQGQGGQPYSHLAEAYMLPLLPLMFTSGATPADLLATSMAAQLFSSTHMRAGIGGAQNGDLSCRRRTFYRLSYTGSASKS